MYIEALISVTAGLLTRANPSRARSPMQQSVTITRMKTGFRLSIFLGIALTAAAPHVWAQAGSIQFVARATPSSGLDEPVRGFPFYLLTKSFDDIQKEADLSSPKPDLNSFIDDLDSSYSPALKAWMKKNQWPWLMGQDFLKKLNPTDILGVPEFRQAYLEMNAGDHTNGFPQPKVKPEDQLKNAEKFDKLSAEYVEAVRQYIDKHPDSIQRIEVSFTEINPGPQWDKLLSKRTPEVRRRALELAQSKYLVGRAQTDLQGQGSLNGLAPGTYWISTLDVAAVTGDVRSRWDVPITVRPGRTEYVALSNVNAFQPTQASR